MSTTMEEKLSLNKTVCKIIECVYLQDILDSVIKLEKEVQDLSPEEYLKVSELIRDNLTSYEPQIVLQLVKALKHTKFEEYVNYVIFNLYYYLYLFRNEDYIVNEDMIEVMKELNSDAVEQNIKEAFLYLIKSNTDKKSQ